jgi:hypothetical protein
MLTWRVATYARFEEDKKFGLILSVQGIDEVAMMNGIFHSNYLG